MLSFALRFNLKTRFKEVSEIIRESIIKKLNIPVDTNKDVYIKIEGFDHYNLVAPTDFFSTSYSNEKTSRDKNKPSLYQGKDYREFNKVFKNRIKEYEKNRKLNPPEEIKIDDYFFSKEPEGYKEFKKFITGYDLEEELENNPKILLGSKKDAIEAVGQIAASGLQMHANYHAVRKNLNLAPKIPPKSESSFFGSVFNYFNSFFYEKKTDTNSETKKQALLTENKAAESPGPNILKEKERQPIKSKLVNKAPVYAAKKVEDIPNKIYERIETRKDSVEKNEIAQFLLDPSASLPLLITLAAKNWPTRILGILGLIANAARDADATPVPLSTAASTPIDFDINNQTQINTTDFLSLAADKDQLPIELIEIQEFNQYSEEEKVNFGTLMMAHYFYILNHGRVFISTSTESSEVSLTEIVSAFNQEHPWNKPDKIASFLQAASQVSPASREKRAIGYRGRTSGFLFNGARNHALARIATASAKKPQIEKRIRNNQPHPNSRDSFFSMLEHIEKTNIDELTQSCTLTNFLSLVSPVVGLILMGKELIQQIEEEIEAHKWSEKHKNDFRKQILENFKKSYLSMSAAERVLYKAKRYVGGGIPAAVEMGILLTDIETRQEMTSLSVDQIEGLRTAEIVWQSATSFVPFVPAINALLDISEAAVSGSKDICRYLTDLFVIGTSFIEGGEGEKGVSETFEHPYLEELPEISAEKTEYLDNKMKLLESDIKDLSPLLLAEKIAEIEETNYQKYPIITSENSRYVHMEGKYTGLYEVKTEGENLHIYSLETIEEISEHLDITKDSASLKKTPAALQAEIANKLQHSFRELHSSKEHLEHLLDQSAKVEHQKAHQTTIYDYIQEHIHQDHRGEAVTALTKSIERVNEKIGKINARIEKFKQSIKDSEMGIFLLKEDYAARVETTSHEASLTAALKVKTEKEIALYKAKTLYENAEAQLASSETLAELKNEITECKAALLKQDTEINQIKLIRRKEKLEQANKEALTISKQVQQELEQHLHDQERKSRIEEHIRCKRAGETCGQQGTETEFPNIGRDPVGDDFWAALETGVDHNGFNQKLIEFTKSNFALDAELPEVLKSRKLDRKVKYQLTVERAFQVRVKNYAKTLLRNAIDASVAEGELATPNIDAATRQRLSIKITKARTNINHILKEGYKLVYKDYIDAKAKNLEGYTQQEISTEIEKVGQLSRNALMRMKKIQITEEEVRQYNDKINNKAATMNEDLGDKSEKLPALNQDTNKITSYSDLSQEQKISVSQLLKKIEKMEYFDRDFAFSRLQRSAYPQKHYYQEGYLAKVRAEAALSEVKFEVAQLLENENHVAMMGKSTESEHFILRAKERINTKLSIYAQKGLDFQFYLDLFATPAVGEYPAGKTLAQLKKETVGASKRRNNVEYAASIRKNKNTAYYHDHHITEEQVKERLNKHLLENEYAAFVKTIEERAKTQINNTPIVVEDTTEIDTASIAGSSSVAASEYVSELDAMEQRILNQLFEDTAADDTQQAVQQDDTQSIGQQRAEEIRALRQKVLDRQLKEKQEVEAKAKEIEAKIREHQDKIRKQIEQERHEIANVAQGDRQGISRQDPNKQKRKVPLRWADGSNNKHAKFDLRHDANSDQQFFDWQLDGFEEELEREINSQEKETS